MNSIAAAAEVLLLPATRRDGEAIAAFFDRHQIRCTLSKDCAATAEGIRNEVGALVLTDQVVADSSVYLISRALAGQPAWSDLPVILLSKIGSESREASEFVRRLTNVTLLDRPASTRTLLSAVQSALRSRAKQYQMREQLAALQAAESELRQSDRRKDEFLAMLAHELRNPLAPIRNAVNLLPQLIAAQDDRTKATLGVIDRQVVQLTRLVDDLLDVSRITQGRIEIKRTTVDLSAVLSQALESVEPLMRDKKHVVLSSPSASVYVEGDDARLVQCVSNVLVNAAKYTDPGGTISVRLSCDEQRATVTVSDTGVGMPPELLPRVFELFVQDSRSLDRSQGGLGIGLSVVRKLIEMHGGEVHASSEGLNRGSTFAIGLPRVPAPATTSASNQMEKTKGSLRILVVDDNQDAADSLAMLLSLDGHTTKAVYHPRDAIGLAGTFDPQLILLDIGLPDIDGYEVARRLRNAGVRARLVALTGYGQRDDVERARAAGFDSHLVKPVDDVNLAKVISQAVTAEEGQGGTG